MPNKDVNLTITAKNAATKTIQSVNSALKELKASQGSANRESAKAGSVISRLSTEYAALTGQAKKLKAAAEISGSINKATSAVKRLSDTAKIASANQKLLEQDMKASKAQTSALAGEQDRLSRVYEKQGLKLKAAKEARARLRKELTLEENLYKRVSRAAASSTQTSFSRPAAQSAAVFQADGVGDQRVELMRLQSIVDDTTASMKKLKSEQQDTNAQFKQASTAQSALSREYDKLSSTVDRNNKGLAEGRAELDKIQQLARNGGIAALAADQEKLEASTRQVVDEMARLQRVNEALGRFSGGDGVFTNPQAAAQLREQREEVNKARAAYDLLNKEYERLSSSSRAVLAPQSNAAKAAREVGVAAKAAKAELDKQIAALERLPGAARQAGNAGGGLFRNYNSEGRTALSLTQRLRAEVIGLALAYGGLHEALRLMNEVVNAYRTLESAQNRLMVVMQGDTRATADELGFLERQAARLGVDFGILADEYSKFAVASNAAGFSGDSTRKVFLSMAEAGRVNKLSTEQMSGVFLALTQIMSKGKFSAEEVTRQLGDRLPGAANILAEALFGSADATDQLFDAMKKGEVLATEDNLLKFADTLNSKFGPQLSESLRTTTTLIGQFTNELFQSKLRIGEGGFIDALNLALQEMITYFRSREGRDFFLAVGAAMGKVVSIVPVLVENFGVITTLIRTFISFKLAQWLVSGGAAMIGLARNIGVARAGFIGLTASMRTGQGAMAGLAVGAARLRVALLAIPGGLAIAALATGISLLIGQWTGGVTEVNSGIDEHRRIMEVVLSTYDTAKDKAAGWAAALPDDIGLPEVEESFLRQLDRASLLLAELEIEAKQAYRTIARTDEIVSGGRVLSLELQKLTQAFQDTRDVEAYKKGLQDLASEVSDFDARQLIFGLIDTAKAGEEAVEDLGEAAVVAVELGSEMESAANVADKYGRSLEDMTTSVEEAKTEQELAAERAATYAELMGELGQQVSSVKKELAFLEQSNALDKMADELTFAAASAEEVIAAMELIALAKEELRGKIFGDEGLNAGNFESEFVARRAAGSGSQEEELVRSAVAVAQQLGVAAEDLLTVISYETGGSLSPSQLGPTTQWGQHFGLIQFGDGPGATGEQYGVSTSSTVTEQMIAAGKYLADRGVEAGDGLLQIYAAINAGSPDRIYASDENNGGAPGTVLDKVNDQMDDHRARAEGLLAAYSGVTRTVEQQLDAEKEAAELRAEEQAATQEAIADTAFQIEQQDLINAGRERQAAIEEAVRDARSDNSAIGEAELALIREQAGALYDKENALSAEEQRKKEIAEVDENLNNLETERNALIEKRDLYKEQGNEQGVAETQTEIDAVTLSLNAAYESAIQFWQAMGGPGAAAAIAQLEASKVGLDDLKEKVLITAEEINNQLADGIANSFKSFAEAIANGENAVDAFWQAFRQFAADFLIQIGQMIVKQLFLNALSAAFGGTTGGVGGVIAGGIASIFHEGGVAGEAAPARAVSPSWFTNATRYHTGGIAGLAPNEVPAILEKNEEVLPENDPRHRNNAGGRSGERPLRIINTLDAVALLEAALADAGSDEVIVNKMRDLKDDIRPAIGV